MVAPLWWKGTLRRARGVIAIIRLNSGAASGGRVHLVQSGWHGESSGSFVFFGFIRARPGGRKVHSAAPLRSLASFGFIGFIRERPWGCRDHLGTFARSFGFSLVRCVHSGAVCVSSAGSMGLFLGVVGFIRSSFGAPKVLFG